MAVYGYCRVSTGRQADEGESLGEQKRRIDGYAHMNFLDVDHMFVERGVSGSVPLGERPEGMKLMTALKPSDLVISPRLDRCFRSARDALNVAEILRSKKVALHLIDLGGDVATNGLSKLFFTILSAVAEAERDRIRERVTDVKRDQRVRGRYLGGTIPFGWHIGGSGELIPVPAQQQAIQAMLRMQTSGASLRAIAETMRADGHTVTHMSVRRILRDAATVGDKGRTE